MDDGRIPVGIDVGSGFTKIVGNGKKARFPSLFASIQAGEMRNVNDMKIKKGPAIEVVGEKAVGIGKSKNGILIRPVKYGMPFSEKGYGKLVEHAVEQLGIPKERYGDIVICGGVTFDAKKQVKDVFRIINKALKPKKCLVLPQAVGTLLACKRNSGIIVNVGHGTTEIIQVRDDHVDGISIRKATEFVIGQITKERGAYTSFEKIIEQNMPKAKELTKMLAEHIADEIARLDTSTLDIIIAGGGSKLPEIKEALEKILRKEIITVDDPIFSNAMGFESMAREVEIKPEPAKPAQPAKTEQPENPVPGPEPDTTKA